MILKNKLQKIFLNKIQRKIGFFFSLIMIIILALAVYIYFKTSTNHFRQNLRRRLHDIVSISALDIDTGLHAVLTEPDQENNETYMVLKKKLQQIRDATSDIYFIYTMRYDEDTGISFVVDAEEDEEEIAHLGDIYTEASDFLREQIPDMDEPMVEEDFYTDNWGTWLTGYAPIYDGQGKREAILGIDIKADTVKKYEHQLMWVAIIMMLVAFPTIFFLGWYFGREIARPIVSIADTSSRIANGDLSLKVAVNSHDEIGMLALSFNKMTIQLNEMISNLEEKVKERTAELSKEIEERKITEKKLMVSERNYNAIMHDPSTFIGTTKPDGTLITANGAALTFIGKELKDVKGKKFWDTPWWEHSIILQERLKQSIFQAANGERAHFEASHKGKDGSEIFVDFSVRPVLDEFGNINSLIVEGIDISELKSTQEALRTNRERLKTAASILRHDITNDLTVIQSALYLYVNENDESMLDEIKSRVDMSLDTITRQREHENFLSTHAELDIYNIHDVLQTVLQKYDSLETTINGTCQVFADRAIYSVIGNIVTNAVQHGRMEKLDVDISEENDFCTVRIVDYGTGIPDEIKDRIFEKGFHYGPAGHTGIGLYIVKKTMEEFGGEVYVEDNHPNGTVIILKMRKVVTSNDS